MYVPLPRNGEAMQTVLSPFDLCLGGLLFSAAAAAIGWIWNRIRYERVVNEAGKWEPRQSDVPARGDGSTGKPVTRRKRVVTTIDPPGPGYVAAIDTYRLPTEHVAVCLFVESVAGYFPIAIAVRDEEICSTHFRVIRTDEAGIHLAIHKSQFPSSLSLDTVFASCEMFEAGRIDCLTPDVGERYVDFFQRLLRACNESSVRDATAETG